MNRYVLEVWTAPGPSMANIIGAACLRRNKPQYCPPALVFRLKTHFRRNPLSDGTSIC
jgi:hypothetical protein